MAAPARFPHAMGGRTAIRLAVGVAQGVALGLLTIATTHRPDIPPPWPVLLATRLLTSLPTVFLLVFGRLRRSAIAALLAIVAAIVLAVALHQVEQGMAAMSVAAVSRWLLTDLAVFILASMALAAGRDGRMIASYPSLFEASWDLATLLSLALLFVVLSWAVIWLAAALFSVIGLSGLARLLAHPWIHPIVGSVAFASAIAWCIDGDRLVAGARALMLALFGLLLPILAVLAGAFLVALCVVGSARLWSTHHHTALLLSTASVMLVLLLNAAHQDGLTRNGAAMGFGARLAAIEILPLAALASTALWLRVRDVGWSEQRVLAAAGFVLLGWYGCGYLLAACVPGRRLRLIEPVNVGGALLTVLVVVALLTSLADPARLAVASQVGRLRSGAVPVERFDFAALASRDGRYGRAALRALTERPPMQNGAAIARRARAAMSASPSVGVASIGHGGITMHPSGAALPDDLRTALLGQTTTSWTPAFSCFRGRGDACDAVLLPAGSDGRGHVAILAGGGHMIALFDQIANGWRYAGEVFVPTVCAADIAALLAGQAKVVSVARPALAIGTSHYAIPTPRPPASRCGD